MNQARVVLWLEITGIVILCVTQLILWAFSPWLFLAQIFGVSLPLAYVYLARLESPVKFPDDYWKKK